jgi:hypothetical protein
LGIWVPLGDFEKRKLCLESLSMVSGEILGFKLYNKIIWLEGNG